MQAVARMDSAPPKYKELLLLLAAMAANCVPQAPEPGTGLNLPLWFTAPNRPLRRGTPTMYLPQHSRAVASAARSGCTRAAAGFFAYRGRHACCGCCLLLAARHGRATSVLADTLAGTTGHHRGSPLLLMALALLLSSPASMPTHIPAAGPAGNRAQRVKTTTLVLAHPQAGTRGYSTASAAPGAPLRLLALLLLVVPPASRTAVAKLWRTRTRICAVDAEVPRETLSPSRHAANCVPCEPAFW